MPDENKKQWGIGALCVLLIALAAFAIKHEMPPPIPSLPNSNHSMYPGGGGAPGGARKPPPGTGGKITTVTAQAITVQPRQGAAMTYTLTPATKITIDRKPATAADLKAGLRGMVVSKDKKTADEVHIRTGAGRGGPGGGGFGGPGGPGGPGGGFPGGGPGGPPGGYPGGGRPSGPPG